MVGVSASEMLRAAPVTDDPPLLLTVLTVLTNFMARDVYYECQRCTACCRWPGQVKIGEQEIMAMAKLLGMGEAEFIQQHTRLRSQRDGLALKDKENGECVFLDGRDCRVQIAKPSQCKGFPNTWNFPDWRSVCEAVPRLVGETS